jgi:hypothetical protein
VKSPRLPAAFPFAALPALLVAALGLGSGGCAAPRTPAWQPPSRAELEEAHTRLTAWRAALGPRTEEVRIAVEAPLLPVDVRARGAVAAVPGTALRMILVGPGGGTAADLWMDRDRHRLAMPARDEVLRGVRGDTSPLVPLDLLRAWFLEPLAGDVLDASVEPEGLTVVLGTPEAVVFATFAGDGSMVLERVPRAWRGASPDLERIRASGTGCGEVVYERPRTGVRATIACEGRRQDVNARALVDPDAAEDGG